MCIEPPEYVLGPLRNRSYGDTDLILYSLAKYLRLAIKGNPTVMLPLFAPEASLVILTPLGEELRAMKHAFLCQTAVERFLGYMQSQTRACSASPSATCPTAPS